MKPSKWFSKKIYEAIPFYEANKIKLINFAFLLQSFRIALISWMDWRKKMAKNQHIHKNKRKRMGKSSSFYIDAVAAATSNEKCL